MSRLIYIDANIYLRFFDSNSGEFKKLLKSIEEVKDHIFVTRQIQSEVERNKVQVFIRSFNNYESQFTLQDIKLPEHLETDTDKKSKRWNGKTQKLADQVKNQNQKLKEISAELVDRICIGEDEVSKVLSIVFEKAESHNEDQIKKARERKELGNPPGKKNDPLGDQLSWEQVLGKTPEIDELLIITNDSDYFYTHKKKSALNPLLLNELKQKNNKLKIYCFDTLSEALKFYNSGAGGKIKTLPEEEQLEKITEEEKKSNDFQPFLSGLTSFTLENPTPNYLIDANGNYIFPMANTSLKKCPFCQNIFFGQQSFHTTNQGDTIMGYRCPNCGNSFQTPFYSGISAL